MKKSMLSKNVLLSFCFVLLLSTSCCATGVDLDPVPDSNVSSASKISIAPLNPAFIQYQEEFELNQNEISANTNTITVSSLILSDISDETPSSDLLNMIDILQYSELPENTIHSTGLIPSPVDLSHLSPVNMEELMANEEYGLSLSTVAPTGMVFYPSRYDLRDNNGVTGVRDQANAGSCWAHSGIASLESYLLHNRSQTWDFSENNV